MLSKEEMGEMARRRQPCPYGRNRVVGSVECENCRFNKMESVAKQMGSTMTSSCSGDVRSVAEHVRRMKRFGVEVE